MVTFNDKIELTNDTAHLLSEIASQNNCSEFDVIEAIVEDWALAKLTSIEDEEQWQN